MAADPLSRAFSALADPTRRDLVARLADPTATPWSSTSTTATPVVRGSTTRTSTGARCSSSARCTEVRPDERIVQTFTFGGYPDGVSLETLTFEDLGDGRTRIVGTSLVESLESRDMILASGMEVGVVEGYEQLDELLGRMA